MFGCEFEKMETLLSVSLPPLADHKRPVVVLLLQADRVHGHLLLHPEEEQPPGHISSYLPPHQHAQYLVVRYELDPLRPL